MVDTQPRFIFELDAQAWDGNGADDSLAAHLESGEVISLPHLAFLLLPEEHRLLTPDVSGAKSKNVGYTAATDTLGGTDANDATRALLKQLLARYADTTQRWMHQQFSHYRGHLRLGRTSFRPVEIAGRKASWRKDDTRLHVDSFPATPLRGERILRVFSNVNPQGKPRAWRVGPPFPDVAQRFRGKLHAPLPGSAVVLHRLGVTKSPRTPYDHYMLQLHDAMKADAEFQRDCPQLACAFPAGGTWLCYTDQVAHAAMAGQFVLEQTFYLPVSAMADASKSPLHVLERMFGRALA